MFFHLFHIKLGFFFGFRCDHLFQVFFMVTSSSAERKTKKMVIVQ
tara:strand:- start:14542 stop:14676 length:135 start_codon:yes stop_codon:yes gene_type:complete